MTIDSTKPIVSSQSSQGKANTESTPSGSWGTSPWGDTIGRFVTSPWEGLRWEACTSPVPHFLAEAEERIGLDNFLYSLMYGE